ncbi:MAG: hypothetical protein LBU88_04095 [Treponema sp.]|jgi:hypothetical protein|nr:hypothetical protein [Treponema sp.]
MKLIKTIAIIAVLALVFSTLFFTTCFSDWQSDAVGYISINLGASGTSARSIADLITNNDDITRYDIKLTSPGNDPIELSFIITNTTETIAVPSGEWTIEVWAYGLFEDDFIIRLNYELEGDDQYSHLPGYVFSFGSGQINANWNEAEYLRGYGKKTITVMPRGRGYIEVTMLTVIEVDGIEQFIAALEVSEKERIILLKEDIDISSPIEYEQYKIQNSTGPILEYQPVIENRGLVTLIADKPVNITGFYGVADNNPIHLPSKYNGERVKFKDLIDFSHPNITIEP